MKIRIDKDIVTFTPDAVTTGNYTLTADQTLSAAATITPKTISVSGIQVADKVYDGTIDAEVTAAYAENSGMLDADVPFVTLKAENGTFTDKNAGENTGWHITMLNSQEYYADTFIYLWEGASEEEKELLQKELDELN